MRRSQKLLVTFLVVGAATLLIAWNTSADAGPAALGVTQAKREAATLGAAPVQVRGTVMEASVLMNESRVESFVIADSDEQMRVEYGRTAPDNFGPKEVVVRGHLRVDADGSVVLMADEIQVGCSSKY
ncbi:MAG TPA: cytochrome c maturation protein CcmE [Candidatus Thermoplasmatota archaeon]|nr:cytochrome c maturation protein CcmE [Candidatus Thermoplasmatota archaeon]